MTDFKRDRWGRPLIIPAGGGDPVAYQRFSSFGQVLENRFNLEKWKLRTLANGLASRPDLFAQIAAAKDDQGRVDPLIEQALDAGGANTAANTGTAMHEFAELVETGQLMLSQVPDPWQADVQALLSTVADLGLVLRESECKLVHDGLRLAGTADRFYERPDGRLVCADLKTGKKISPNPLAYAVQLAAYAGAVLYDLETGQRRAIGDVDQEIGLLIHLPVGQAVCTIWEVDLQAGRDLADLASRVHTAQKDKTPIARPLGEAPKKRAPRKKAAAAVSPQVAPAPAEPAANPAETITEASASPWWAEISAQQARAPFQPADDNSPRLATSQIEQLKTRYLALPGERLQWCNTISTQATQNAATFHMGSCPTSRAWYLISTLVGLAEADECSDETVRTLAATIWDTNLAHHPAVPVGLLLGAMNLEQASQLAAVTGLLIQGLVTIHMVDGLPRINTLTESHPA